MRLNGFKSDYTGLNNKEVKESIEKYGINSLGSAKKETLFKKILNTFKEPMLLLLLGTSLIYLILGDLSDSLIMFIFIFVVSGISFFQEYKTDKALEVLKELSSPKSKVIRNNEIIEIKSSELVVGDIMLIHEGDVINSDCNILEYHGLGINESSLTGESITVWKKIKLNDDEINEYFKKNKCYAGTVVTSGSAVVLITNVGINTEYGKIGNELNKITYTKTPLEKQVHKLIIVCASVSVIFLLLVASITFLNTMDSNPTIFHRITDAILAGVTIAMATIPEEIPVILTVFLTMGAYLISKKKSLVRKVNAVETLGSISVLCVDKTGTLTENKMTVVDYYVYDNMDTLIKTSCLSCEAEAYDPMEKAITTFCEKEGKKDKYKSYISTFNYPFSSESKIVGHVYEKDNNYELYVKGAYEKVLPLCNLSKEEENKIKTEIRNFSEKGYRVLALANGTNDKIKSKIEDYALSFVGLLAFTDPPRRGIKEAVETCYNAGIKLVMITGDSGDTARTIAKEIGFKNYNQVITGEELENMNDEELKSIVKDVTIFARVYPNHKMRIVDAFQKNKMVVAMTGDGVNDATALKKAEIGIAMGQRGTEVAKEAAKIILLDDNFKTIVEAIKNGRRIYENIRKAVGYVLIIHIPIALIAFLVPLLKLPIFLLPIHVVILELIIDPTSSIIFERASASKGIMKRLPRKLDDSLLEKKHVFRYIIQGLIIFTSFFFSYLYLLNNDYSKDIALTFALTVLILSNLFVVYVNIQEDNFTITNFINTLKDKVISGINLIILIGLLLIIYLPFFQRIVGTASLTLYQVLFAILIALVSTIWYDIIKIIKKLTKKIN